MIMAEVVKTFELGLMNSAYDAWISDEQLQSFDDEDVAWFKEEMGLSRDGLFRIFARAKQIVEQFKPNDEFLSLTYDTDCGNWYIHFDPTDSDGRPTDVHARWRVSVYRHEEHLKEPTHYPSLARQ
jgi:hypothetical protein